jgi:Mg2+-importing ATPase
MTVQTKNRNKKARCLCVPPEAQNGIAETLVNLNTTREGLQEARQQCPAGAGWPERSDS